MTAWDELIAKSTALPGSDAWTHLTSQSPGGGGTVILEGERHMELADQELDMSIAATELHLEVGEPAIAMVESSGEMIVDTDDGGMTIGD